MILTAEFQVVDPATSARTPLPDVESWTVSPISDGSGIVQLTYPSAGRNFADLRAFVDDDRDTLLIVRIGGQETPSFDCVLTEEQGDSADPAASCTFSGRFLVTYLDQAVIYPNPSSPVVTPGGGLGAGSRSFGAMNAGQVFAPLMAEAHARGAASLVTYATFNSVHDSNGIAWTEVVTTSCSPGISILSLLNTLSQAGLMEWEMAGADLRLYNPGTLGRDLTLSTPPVILHGPRDLTQAQRTFSSLGAVTALLAAGGGGLYTTASDSAALTRRGRRIEGYVSSAGITDAGTLSAYAATQLSALKTGVLQVTHGLALDGSGPQPYADFDVNDWIWSDTGNGLERLQVAQWSVSRDANGILTGTVTLNNLVASKLVKLQRRIASLEGGTTVVGTSSPPPPPVDMIAPNPPTGLTASSLIYVDGTGVTRAQVTAGWTAPTTNVDSSALIDLQGYALQWRYSTGQGLETQWNLVPGIVPAGTTTLSWSPLLPSVNIDFQVEAIKTSGTASAFSATHTIATAANATTPPVPSTPSASPYLGQLLITWDGKAFGGGAMPPDFAVCQVHVSLSSGFTPSPATLTDLLNGAGSSIASGLIYGDTYYVKLVAENRSALVSAASAQTSAVPVQAGNGDISSLNVGKLTAGTLSANVIIGARFTTSLTGQRTEISNLGFFQYDATGLIKLVEISNSNISITGQFFVEGTDGSFISLWTNPGFAVIQLEPGGGMTHISTPMEIFASATGAGTSTERSLLVMSSGRESTHDDAALQLFSSDASNATAASAAIEFGGSITASFDKTSATISPSGTTQVHVSAGFTTISNTLALNNDVKFQPSGTPTSWDNASLINGWSGTLQTRLRVDGGVAVRCVGALSAGTLTDGTQMGAVANTGYEPSSTQRLAVIITGNTGGGTADINDPYVTINTSGQFIINGLSGPHTSNIWIQGVYWLD